MKRLSPDELDEMGERLELLALEQAQIQDALKAQIDAYGSIPPRAEKSKRLTTETFQFTLSTSTTTEVLDGEVERIRESCPETVFSKLFVSITKYKLAKDAMRMLAGTLPEDAPRNLRQMFSRAVIAKESAPRLQVKRICEVPA